jgi:hypothetical protein
MSTKSPKQTRPDAGGGGVAVMPPAEVARERKVVKPVAMPTTRDKALDKLSQAKVDHAVAAAKIPERLNDLT